MTSVEINPRDVHPHAGAAAMPSRGTYDQHVADANAMQNVSNNLAGYASLGNIGHTGGHVVFEMPWNRGS